MEAGYFAELLRLDKDPEVAEGRIRNLRDLMATMDGSSNAPMERLENFWRMSPWTAIARRRRKIRRTR